MNADLILVGGRVFTVDGSGDAATAVGVKNGRIVYVGDDAGARAMGQSRTRVVELGGRTLAPGFIDAHCHIAGWGAFISGLDLKSASSIDDIKVMVRERAAVLPPGSWIRGRGYNQLKLREGRHPGRWDLDEAAPHHPVSLTRCCGHICAVNSSALRAAGLDSNTPDPPGGVMDRDSGRLTGVLRETAQAPLRKVSALPPREWKKHYVAGCRDLVIRGITGAHDAGRPVPVSQLARWHASEEIPLRVFATVAGGVEGDPLPDEGGSIHYLQGDLYFRVGHLKIVADGSSSGPTAATREPYATEPDNYGVQVTAQEAITDKFIRANRLGFSLTTHAVGDRGIEMTLNAQEAALADRPRDGLGDHYRRVPRHRIEHCAMAAPDLRDRIRAAGVVPVAQSIFLEEYGDNYINDYGRVRAEAMFPLGSFLREGIPVALSSDAPVSHPDPFRGIAAALTRLTEGGEVLGEGERISLAEAVRCYTLNAAYAEHAEDIKGSLQVGKLADMVVIDGPFLDSDPSELGGCTVDMTIIGGDMVYER